MIEKILIYIPKIIEHTYIAKAFYNVLINWKGGKQNAKLHYQYAKDRWQV